MQTTLRINDATYRRAKAKAGAMGQSLTRFFEEAVEERLSRIEERPSGKVNLPVSSACGASLTEAELKAKIEAAQYDDDLAKVESGGAAG